MTSILKTNAIEPEGATTTLTIGNVGQNVVIGADSIKNNVWKDAGGNALFTSNGSGVLSGVNSGFGSAQTLIQSQTASTSSSVSFTSGLDSTYKEYVFEVINVHPATDATHFTFNGSTDGGSNYNQIKTTSFFYALHDEANTLGALTYEASLDLAQSTAYQPLMRLVGNDNDQAGSGELHIFNPSSTTYIKNWYWRSNSIMNSDYSVDIFVAGYFNITTVIDAIDFKFASGNIDAGTIKMYGIK
jgi:hypothetical protein